MQGKVKWWDKNKGYGYIICDGAPGEAALEAFVHYREVRMDGRRNLAEDMRVDFDLVMRQKGLRAVNVRPLEVPAAHG